MDFIPVRLRKGRRVVQEKAKKFSENGSVQDRLVRDRKKRANCWEDSKIIQQGTKTRKMSSNDIGSEKEKITKLRWISRTVKRFLDFGLTSCGASQKPLLSVKAPKMI